MVCFFDVMPGDSSFYKLMTDDILAPVSCIIFFGEGRSDDSRDGGSNGENLIVVIPFNPDELSKGCFLFNQICLDGGNSTDFFICTPEKGGKKFPF